MADHNDSKQWRALDDSLRRERRARDLLLMAYGASNLMLVISIGYSFWMIAKMACQ